MYSIESLVYEAPCGLAYCVHECLPPDFSAEYVPQGLESKLYTAAVYDAPCRADITQQTYCCFIEPFLKLGFSHAFVGDAVAVEDYVRQLFQVLSKD